MHGFERTSAIAGRDAGADHSVRARLRDGRIVAYASGSTSGRCQHGVAETDEDMKALLLGAGAARGRAAVCLVPVESASLFRWCPRAGAARAVKPMNLMALGEYQEPNGCYFVSVLY